jgi:Zn-dependent protease
MKWSLDIGRWFGIPVKLHFTFLLMLGLLALAGGITGGSVGAGVAGVTFFAALFGCVLLHELGHALMARRFGVGTRDITLLPIGGVARLERLPDHPWQEFWIAVAGPAVNVGIGAALAVWLAATGGFDSLAAIRATSGDFTGRLLAANVFLVLFNLLPAFPMDGGRILRSLLALRLHPVRATEIAGRLGQGMAVLFGIAGLFTNPMLLLIAFFVWVGAGQEMGAARARAALAGMTIGEAMLTDYRVLEGGERLGDVARRVLAGSQQDFPVVEGGGVTGLLERRHLLDGLTRLGPDAPVTEVMCREFPRLDPAEPIEELLAGNRHAGFPMLPVTSEGRLVGLFTMENLSELLRVQSALAARAPFPETPQSVLRIITSRPPPLPQRA